MSEKIPEIAWFAKKITAMKRNVIVFGVIAGVIMTAMIMFSTVRGYLSQNWDYGVVIGYTSMVLAFSLIFVGVRNYRDKFNEGAISFGKAFRIGLYITLIASTMYVIAWLICYYLFIPDFMDRYAEYMLSQSAGTEEASKKMQEIESWRELYKSPVWVILLTYMEILPVGLIISLICALILKRRDPRVTAAAN
jgi:hypothetical protein